MKIGLYARFPRLWRGLLLCLALCVCLGAWPGEARAREPFRLLCTVENQDMESLVRDVAKDQQIGLEVTYQTTMEMMSTLEAAACPYDGVWLSNSLWLSMLRGGAKITDSRVTSINPIVFGIAKDKARELGFVGKDVYMADLVAAVESGKLRFIMPAATQTNSGASAYLGFLSALAGNPEVLTLKDLQAPSLKRKLRDLFSGVVRHSGSEDYLMSLYLSGGYNAMVNYEFLMIAVNRWMEALGREPLYLIYPKDGVSLSDAPFAYVDHGDKAKKEQFLKLQGYLLSSQGQKDMAGTGRRTGYGGLNPYGDEATFNPDWGIDMHAYLSPIKAPSAEVIRAALALYQTELKKPSITVFCLDFSGSMAGKGHTELMDAMNYLLTPATAAKEFMQFGARDMLFLIPFDSEPRGEYRGTGKEQEKLLKSLAREDPGGGTNIYAALAKAYDTVKGFQNADYTISIVLMTDGQSDYEYSKLEAAFQKCTQDVGVYSITFGEADPTQLNDIAELTGGMVFDGTTDLLAAFRTVRGYN